MSVGNPWAGLPRAPDYVLPEDAPYVRQFNAVATFDYKYDLSLLPEPYFGRPDAPVLLLALNPGLAPADHEVHRRETFREDAFRSLEHALTPNPFLHLNQDGSTAGGRWWRRVTAELLRESDIERVGRSLFCVQLFAYHSKAFASPRMSLPSQQYSVALVRAGLARSAEVVIMRSRKIWEEKVPELKEYEHLHVLRNPRNPTLSRGNLGAAFEQVLHRVQAGA